MATNYLHKLRLFIHKKSPRWDKELQNITEVWDYFEACAVCGHSCEAGEKAGFVSAGDLVVLPVCLQCCQRNPQIKAVIPKQLTYHDVSLATEH